jgi:hypothetical protein
MGCGACALTVDLKKHTATVFSDFGHHGLEFRESFDGGEFVDEAS